MKLQPVILCGGSGTRLWPLSREQYPKQLLALEGSETLLQATARRIDGALAVHGFDVLSPIVVANEEYRFITAEQLRQAGIHSATLLLEPVGRNTAPALTLAALAAGSTGDDPVLVVMPADHAIEDVTAFRSAVMQCTAYAESGQFVTFGVRPTRPETGYGYIRTGSVVDEKLFIINGFHEKPDAEAAERYRASGEFLWNSGIFMMRASAWLKQVSNLREDILAACRTAFSARRVDRDFLRIDTDAFTACPADSIDYAVMEKLPQGQGIVMPLSAGWSDIGAWDALWHLGKKDDDGNLLVGDAISVGSQNTLAISQSRLVACVGIADAVVVETPDAVLVADKGRIQEVKNVVERLKREGRTEAIAHRKVYRPWGYYDSIDDGNRFQVKRIVVHPGSALSLQMHHHRAEHWIVVCGTARVTRGDDTFLVSENESTFIPLGVTHRLENPGKVPLEMIEVQSGAYLGEDDIVRFEDGYGRKIHS